MDHLLGVQAFKIDCAATLSGQALRSADGRGALWLAVNAKFLSRAPASKRHSCSPGIFKTFCLDLAAIWSGWAPPSDLLWAWLDAACLKRRMWRPVVALGGRFESAAQTWLVTLSRCVIAIWASHTRMTTDCVAWADSDDRSHCPVVSPRIVCGPISTPCEIGGACAGAPRLPRQRIGGPRSVSLRGAAGAAFFVARAGQSVPRHARSPRQRGSAETRLPAWAVRGDRQAVACHASQRLGGPVALFPRVGLRRWDLSRCPLALVRRSTSFGLLRATSCGAQAVALPPRHE